MPGGSWSTSLIWGSKHDKFDRDNSNSYLLESVVPIRKRNFVTGRAELVDKDELFEAIRKSWPANRFAIGAYTLGYTRDLGRFHNMHVGIGANATAIPSLFRSSRIMGITRQARTSFYVSV